MRRTIYVICIIAFLAGVGVALLSYTKPKPATPQKYTENQSEETKQETTNESVPLLSGEDVIRTYTSLIDEQNIAEAVGMMNIQDDAVKQSWGVYLDSFSSLTLKRIDPYNKNEWTDTHETFQVLFAAQMKPEAASAAIPNYGWENGDNVRWVSISKVNALWKIAEIATGP